MPTTWLSQGACTALRQMLYELFVESNQPVAPMGIK